jgi:membrane protein DedA with SNARE-associated domain
MVRMAAAMAIFRSPPRARLPCVRARRDRARRRLEFRRSQRAPARRRACATAPWAHWRAVMAIEFAPLVVKYGYAAVVGGSLLEGETVLVLAGLAAHRGYLDLSPLILLGAAGGMLGDVVYFSIGRRFGPALLQRYPRFAPAAARAEALIERFPSVAVIAVRFLYGLRTVGPAVIGTGKIGWPRYLLLNALGALVWSACWVGLGYVLGEAAARVLGNVAKVEREIFVGVALVALIVALVRRARRRPPLPEPQRRD